MNDVSVLDIMLYGDPIGTLTHVAGDRTIFSFREEYIADMSRPTLGLAFKSGLGELITEFKPYQTQLMPFFSNLLPEGHMRSYLAERAGVNPEREYFLLKALGTDLPGAITVRPADSQGGSTYRLTDDALPVDSDDDPRPTALRFSLAGVQLKLSAIQKTRGGLTIPAKGVGGSWIVKFPSPQFRDVPANEYSMMTLARLIGMDVPATYLVPIDTIDNLPGEVASIKGTALAVERFDRLTSGEAVHIEDFAQIFGLYPREKYKKASFINIASVIAAEGGETDVAEFIRRLTFNTLIGNGDMHVKNWSVIYPDKRKAALAPAYDFVSTISYIQDEQSALKFSRTKSFTEFTEDELAHLAARASLPERLVLDTARETVALFHQHWAQNKRHLPLSQEIIDSIENHLKTLPITHENTAH